MPREIKVSVSKVTLAQLFAAGGKLDEASGLVVQSCTGRMNRQTALYDITITFVDRDPERTYDITNLDSILGAP